MRALIKIETNDIMNIEIHDLASLIWGISKDNLWVNHDGTGETLKDSLHLSLSLFPSDLDSNWDEIKYNWGTDQLLVNKLKGSEEIVAVFTEFETALPYTEKGFFNLIAYLADKLSGQISQDDGENWESVSQFKKEHEEVMQADFFKLLSDSVEMGKNMAPKDEPKYFELLNDKY